MNAPLDCFLQHKCSEVMTDFYCIQIENFRSTAEWSSLRCHPQTGLKFQF